MCFFVVVEKHLCKKKLAFPLRNQFPSSNTPQNVSLGFLSPLLLLRLPVCVDESSSALEMFTLVMDTFAAEPYLHFL